MLETAAGSSAPLTCAWSVGTGIYTYTHTYIDIRDSWRSPNKLLILVPFAYNYPSSGSPYIRAAIPVIHTRPWLGFRVKIPHCEWSSVSLKCFWRSIFLGKTRGCVCSNVALPFTLKLSILRRKKNYGNSIIFHHSKNIIFKKSSKWNQNPSRYYYNNSIITNLKFQPKPKYHLSKILILKKIDLLLFII